jgi:hypothetical protein
VANIEDIIEIFIATVTDGATPIQHSARSWLQSTGHQPHQCGFAGAIGTLKLHNIPSFNTEVGWLKDIAVIALKSELLDC